MADHEARVGGRDLSENMVVKTNVKTLLWSAIGLFSALMTIFTFFYFDMKTRDETTNDRLDTVIESVQDDVEETLKNELRIYEERQLGIKDDIGDIRGDIKVILERTSNSNSSFEQPTHNIQDNLVPSSSVPTENIPPQN